jgi:signal transduction histidine kinase
MIRFTLLVVCLLISLVCEAQVEEDRLKASMVYYIAEMVEWPDSKRQEFTIHVLGASSIFIDELSNIASNRNINNKPIRISNGQIDLAKIKPNILYIDKSQNDIVEELHINFAHLPILFVTNEYHDKWYVMINFLKRSGPEKLQFEVNPLNILFTKMDYNEELLNYGQSTFSVKETFLLGYNRQNRIINQIDSLEKVNLSIKEVNKALEIQIGQQEWELNYKNEKLRIMDDSLAYQIELLNIHSSILTQQQKKIEEQEYLLETSNAQFTNLVKQRNSLKDSIDYSLQLLAELDNEIEERESQIENQNLALVEKESLIKAQTNSLFLLGGLGIAVIFITVLLYRTNRSKEDFNQKLLLANENLASVNDELNTTNTKLAEQKIELETTVNRLNDTQNMLVQSEKLASLGVFTSGIAHELNNPINYISAGSQALFESLEHINKEILQLKPELSDEIEIQKSLRESIEMGVERSISIISSLRNYAHSSNDNFMKYNIVTSINDALTLLRSTYKDNIQLDVSLPEVLEIDCIPGKLNQVFVNIISNGIHAMSSYANNNKGVLHISCKLNKRKNTLKLFFSDTGHGIDKENLSKLFDPFFTTKEVGQGTGLGLYIVHGIINNHKGDIHFKSEIGEGTTVTVTLPISQT